jgi:hypothetical protein
MYSLYRVAAGNFKIQNSLNANADKLIFDSGQAGNSGWLASVSIIEVVI